MDVLSSCIFLQDSLYCLLIMLMMVLKKESPTRMNSIDIPMYIDSSALMAGSRNWKVVQIKVDMKSARLWKYDILIVMFDNTASGLIIAHLPRQ